MKTIFITEKPSVAQEYRKVLGVSSESKTDGYIEGYSNRLGKDVIITWAVGHLVGICTPEEHNENWKYWRTENLPMIPQTFKYKPLPATYKQFKTIKSLYTRNDIESIYYAGDSGREGIYIQALIRNQIFKSKPQGIDERVVWIDSYTEESILKGIKNAKPYSDYQPMIDSGYARAIDDWLIGMNFTEALTIKCGGVKTVINTGRVMTTTEAMVVKRQEEIDNFVKTDFYGITGSYGDMGVNWKADKKSRFYESPLLYNENGFLKESDARNLIGEFNTDKRLTVEDTKVTTKTEYAPYNYNLADLQNECSRRFHISPDTTLKIAQSLYEKKFITYPRTDSRFLSSAVAKEYKEKFGFDIPKRYVDDSKVTDHYALIPTFYGNPDGLLGLESEVYQVISTRFSDTMKPPYIYDSVAVTYLHKNGEPFFRTFKIVKQKGYKEKIDEDTVNESIPKKGDVITIDSFDVRAMETKPPVQYTTGSLILAMEKAGKLIEDEELREQIKTCGIGTSATRAGIIEKLKDKNFITVDKTQKITPTEFGKQVIAITEKFDEQLVSPVKTADMEARLHAIANGELSREAHFKHTSEYVKTTVGKILNESVGRVSNTSGAGHGYDCPCCDKTLKSGKFGFYCDKKTDGCGFSFPNEICGRKLTEKDLVSIIKDGKTKAYQMKSKSGKEFKARLILNKTEHKLDFEFENKQKDR